MVIGHILSPKPKRCALCKAEFNWIDLQAIDGHQVCKSCLRLIRDEGIELPENSDVFPLDQNNGRKTTK